MKKPDVQTVVLGVMLLFVLCSYAANSSTTAQGSGSVVIPLTEEACPTPTPNPTPTPKE